MALKHGNLEKLLLPSESPSKEAYSELIHYWKALCHEESVKKELASASQLPLKLYKAMQHEDIKKEKRIVKGDKLDLGLVVEFIKLMTQGDEELEGEMAMMLMKDLEHL